MLLLCCAVAPLAVFAKQTITSTSAGVTADILQDKIKETDGSQSLDDATRVLLLDLYRKSASFLNQRQSYEAATREFIQLRESAPAQTRDLRAELDKLEALPAPRLPARLAKAPLDQLEQQLLSEKATLSDLRARLNEAAASLQGESQRAQQVRDRLQQASNRQTEIAQSIKVPESGDQSAAVAEARLWSVQLETQALAAEIEMLNQELLSQPMRVELYGAQRDKASLELDRQQVRVDQLSELVGQRRVSDAETAKQEAEQTERQSFGKHPLVQKLAQQNTQLSSDLNDLVAQVESVRADESVINDQVKRFTTSFRLTRQKLEIAGLGQALGQAMLQQRNNLPRARDFQSAEKQREKLVIESSLRQIRNQQERTQLSDVEAYVKSLTATLTPSWQGWLHDGLRDLAQQRRELLDKAIAADDSLLQTLNELDFVQRELSSVVADFNRFLDERLLWVRTGEPPTWKSLVKIGDSLQPFMLAENWDALGKAVFTPQAVPWLLLGGLSIFLLLLVMTPAMRASLRRSGRKVGQLRHDRFYFSIKALVLTLLIASAWPVLFVALGLQLQSTTGAEDVGVQLQLYQVADWSGLFVPSIGGALYDLAFYLFCFSAFRLFCDRHGLAVSHFHWSHHSTSLLRRATLYLMAVFLPFVFLLTATINYNPAALASGFSRILFCVIVFSVAWFFGRVLSPSHGALRDFYRANPGNPITWLRYLWLALGLLLPLLLAMLALGGFVYTAAQLGERVVDTLWLTVAIILFHQLVVRWVVLLERQLEFKDALERHRAQRAARDDPESEVTTVENLEEPEIDYSALSENTKKLINTALIVVAAFGTWAIWSGVLPAFRILDDVSLWSYSSDVEGAVQSIPVTLGDLLTTLLILVFAVIAARRLPALMEIVLFARFNITAGSRYAISQLTQYTIMAFAIVTMFSVLGGSWSQIHWLVAALGVGIGFGLQEIVANFICGLILLFERPIRIGDIVTVGDTTGTVTRIRIRSTTIRNWDNKELLVPNKEFITGRLLNWTLTDPVTRIVLEVGIAYGSDVDKALQIILACAVQHERVLKDPPPQVSFDTFGDNSLGITLRYYIGSMDFWVQTRSEINLTINRKLAAAGIVISFPQRDVHLDTLQPLDVRLHRAPRPSEQT
jgi:potassium efflux system protein